MACDFINKKRYKLTLQGSTGGTIGSVTGVRERCDVDGRGFTSVEEEEPASCMHSELQSKLVRSDTDFLPIGSIET